MKWKTHNEPEWYMVAEKYFRERNEALDLLEECLHPGKAKPKRAKRGFDLLDRLREPEKPKTCHSCQQEITKSWFDISVVAGRCRECGQKLKEPEKCLTWRGTPVEDLEGEEKKECLDYIQNNPIMRLEIKIPTKSVRERVDGLMKREYGERFREMMMVLADAIDEVKKCTK